MCPLSCPLDPFVFAHTYQIDRDDKDSAATLKGLEECVPFDAGEAGHEEGSGVEEDGEVVARPAKKKKKRSVSASASDKPKKSVPAKARASSAKGKSVAAAAAAAAAAKKGGGSKAANGKGKGKGKR